MEILNQLIFSKKDEILKMKSYWNETVIKKSKSDKYKENGKFQRKRLSEIIPANLQSIIDDFVIIGELKAASPSRGLILHSSDLRNNLTDSLKQGKFHDPSKDSSIFIPTIRKIPEKINAMLAEGITALSVLTISYLFHGSYGNLEIVSNTAPLNIPILQKDIIIDEIQLKIGKKLGASNVLLIPKIYSQERFFKFFKSAIKEGLEPLVEINDELDLEKIKPLTSYLSSFVIGINNRNLQSLEIDLNTTKNMFPKIHKIFPKIPVISESGIQSFSNILGLLKTGISGALIGTTITKNGDISNNIRFLLRRKVPFLKICGITSGDIFTQVDFQYCNAIGVIYNIPHSHRNLSIEKIKKIFLQVPEFLSKVIVCKNILIEKIYELIDILSPDFIQVHGKGKFKLIREISKQNPSILKKIILAIENENDFCKMQEDIPKLVKDQIFSFILDASEGKAKSLHVNYARKLISQNSNYRFIISGGINSENFKEIYDITNPFGIDCSSSLENEKGEKDIQKISYFLNKFKEAFYI
ncbi:phosphoribosylanthranilate isomerase [Candidatus Harpocratesius sp.]